MKRATAKFATLCLATALHACSLGEAGTCDVGYTETRPYQNGDPSILLCKWCDFDCSTVGEPCDAFGVACDISGERGVCDTCCDGFTGALRCRRVE